MSGFDAAAQSLRRRPLLVALAALLTLLYLVSHAAHGNDRTRQHRPQDSRDIFAHWRGRSTCAFGALDLHTPTNPVCPNVSSLLSAMSDGGRGGFDMPYQPRGCDLRFYNSAEICEILSRYEGLVLYGDSLLRHVVSAFAILLREDLETGGQMQWLRSEEDEECVCDGQTTLLICHKRDVSNMDEVHAHDPTSVVCKDKPSIRWEAVPKWPIEEEVFKGRVAESVKEEHPTKPYAFFFGHGLWNDLHNYESLFWFDAVRAAIADVRPYYADSHLLFPKAFVGPSAPGEEKRDDFIQTQGNKAIIKFEKFMRAEAPTRGLDFLGTYNMSIQATIPDGTHSGIRVNILKAMTLLNWLDMQDLSAWDEYRRSREAG